MGKKKFFFLKKLKNFISNILQQKIWIYNVNRIHNAQNHGLVHFDANHPTCVQSPQYLDTKGAVYLLYFIYEHKLYSVLVYHFK